MPASTLIEALAARDVDYELLPHARTETAAAEARVLGVSPAATAKTVVARTPAGFVRVVVPASCRIDLARLRRALETDEVALATEAELAGAFPEIELGAVPPFDAKGADATIVDRRLCETAHVVFEAGRHDESVRLATSDLLELSDAKLADVCRR
jgi:Ala-tRNA(Pro) deacylase